MKKLLKNNKGFSLVELIVAFAIMATLAMTVIMVMNAGTNMFTRIDEDINLQYKSQTAMSQFQQYFMGCSKAICNTDDQKVVYFADDKNIYALKMKDNKLYYKEFPYKNADGTLVSLATVEGITADDITDPFCSDVDDFKVVIGGSGKVASTVKVYLNLKDETGKTYSTSQIFSLRSKPKFVKEADPEVEGATIYSTLLTELGIGGA